MSDKVRCFFLDPIDKAEISLRRYRSSTKAACPGRYGYCNAHVTIGQIDHVRNHATVVTDELKTDPRWPKKCEFCDYEFQPDDYWQWNEQQIYKRRDGGEQTILGDAPAGAMWDVHWFKEHEGYKKRADGILLCVRTPGGDWIVDGPSSNGGNGWERTGTVPDVTANPSILMERYHGWLRNGWLEKC